MRIVRLIIRIMICVLCAVFALAFLAIEGFVLIAGEWKLYENSAMILIQQIIKTAAAGAAGYTALMGAFRPNRSSFPNGVRFFMISLISIPFVSNQIGLVFTILSALFIVTDTGLWAKRKRNRLMF